MVRSQLASLPPTDEVSPWHRRRGIRTAPARSRSNGTVGPPTVSGGSGTWEYDRAAGLLSWSHAALDLAGITRTEYRCRPEMAIRIVHPDDRERVWNAFLRCATGGSRLAERFRIRPVGDSGSTWVDLRGIAIAAGGHPVGIRGSLVDVTAEVRARADADAAIAFQRAMLDTSPDIVFIDNLRAGHTDWTGRSIQDVLGYPSGDTPPVADLVHLDDRAAFTAAAAAAADVVDHQVVQLEYRLRAADGTDRWFSRRTSVLHRDRQGRVTHLVGILRDIDEVVATRQRLQHSSLHDGLTGLPNRLLLVDRLEVALARSAHSRREVSVLYCDLDGFKRVNDTAGRAVGDAVLLTIAQRLPSLMRAGDTVARVGADEFAIVLEPWSRTVDHHDPPSPHDDRALTVRVADRIAGAVHDPIPVGGAEYVVSVSIGISHGGRVDAEPTRAPTADALLQDADSAMARAKSLGGSRFEIFEHAMRTDSAERGRVEQLLRQALRDDVGLPRPRRSTAVLTAAYQPVVDAGTDALIGFEALARLTDTAGHPVRPDLFIPIAEETGLIRALGIVMLDTACRQLAGWRVKVPEMSGITMSVNISALHARHPELADDVRRALRRHHLRPGDLILEITETAMLQAAGNTLQTLRALRTDGVGIAIDDFGTGYASLKYLVALPVSSLKIEKSFTAMLPADRISRSIIDAVAGLAAEMALTCVVEGVESDEQRAALPVGVQLQGYLTGRPLHAEMIDLVTLLAPGAERFSSLSESG